MTSGPAQLKDWMHRRKFLQTEAAEYLGVHVTYVSQLLSGARRPGLDNAIDIERKTGIPVEAWLPSERGKSDAGAAEKASKSQVDRA